MSLIQRIKAVLGLDGAPDPGGDEPVAVTVEREREDTDGDPLTGVADPGPDPDPDPDSGTDPDSDTVPAPEPEPTPATESDAVTDESDGDTEPVSDAPEYTHPAPVTEISGIGPSYSERLAEADTVTVGELATANPDDLAAETDISETRITGWIEQAKELATEES